MQPNPTTEHRRVPSARQGIQDGVGTVAHTAQDRSAPLAHYGRKSVRVSRREHRRRTAEARQSHQHPECVIVLDAQIAVYPLRIASPQAT
jgi:hypothetical protein